MNADNKDIYQISHCKLTGLPILQKPEWANINYGNEYFLSISLVGYNYLITEASGYVTIDDIVPASELLNKIIEEYIGTNPYVHIDNLAKVKGSSAEARKFLIDYYKQRPEQFIGLIFHSARPLLRLSVLLAKKLNILKFDFELAKDCPEAVSIAMEMLLNTGTFANKTLSKDPIAFKDTLSSKEAQYFSQPSTDIGNEDSHTTPTSTNKQIEELIEFIGKINWKNEGIDDYRSEREANNPLLPVYDAIAILKSDIDSLIAEKDIAYGLLQDKKIELLKKAKALEESNITLNVLMENMENYQNEIEGEILGDVTQRVLRYIDEVELDNRDTKQSHLINMLKDNLFEIISSLDIRLSFKYFGLTPTEIKVAQFIKQGKSSKEIAETLNISKKTVDNHRQKLRKKLGIKNKKINLISFLSSLK